MPNQHKLRSRAFRPEPDEYEDAKGALGRERTMDGFLRACLRWLRHDPAKAMATLAPFWPEPKMSGHSEGTSRRHSTNPNDTSAHL
ncbi:hypothetical protein GCM10022419_008250 [Nonomuraea rosea]|uniref:Uncharacterized protein n=1 Tax=Nonomuraea rosea TaxID=638574 RepID=A0ABP6VDG7_9ACTN